MNAGLDGRPDALTPDWTSVGEYLARMDGNASVNVGLMVGNSALRIARLGWEDVPADDRGARRYARGPGATRWSAGALGVSSGLDYPPGAFATTDELAALTAEAARPRRLLPHTCSLHARRQVPRSVQRGDRHRSPRRRPAHITHFYHRETHPGGPEPLLALVDDARAEGLDVTFDMYPYEWASTRLLIQLPQWIQEGGPGPLKERLADRAARERLREELRARGAAYTSPQGWADVRLGAFSRPENLRWESQHAGRRDE